MFADLTDKNFKLNPNAVYIVGPYSEPYMSVFAGCGYSQTPYKMKALLIDGIVYVPDKSYTFKTSKRNRDYTNYPMVKARIQPPTYAIKQVE